MGIKFTVEKPIKKTNYKASHAKEFTESKKEAKAKSRASNDQTVESEESPLKDISNMDPPRYSLPFQFAPKRNNYMEST